MGGCGGRPSWPNGETHLAEQWGRSNRRFGSSLPAYLEPRWHRVRPDGPGISTECDRQLDPDHTELSDEPPDEDGRIAGAPACALCYGRRTREERA